MDILSLGDSIHAMRLSVVSTGTALEPGGVSLTEYVLFHDRPASVRYWRPFPASQLALELAVMIKCVTNLLLRAHLNEVPGLEFVAHLELKVPETRAPLRDADGAIYPQL